MCSSRACKRFSKSQAYYSTSHRKVFHTSLLNPGKQKTVPAYAFKGFVFPLRPVTMFSSLTVTVTVTVTSLNSVKRLSPIPSNHGYIKTGSLSSPAAPSAPSSQVLHLISCPLLIHLDLGIHNPRAVAGAKDPAGGKIMSALQDLLAQLKQKGDSSKQATGWANTHSTYPQQALAHPMPPSWRHLGEPLVHAELWATIHQLQGLENVASLPASFPISKIPW